MLTNLAHLEASWAGFVHMNARGEVKGQRCQPNVAEPPGTLLALGLALGLATLELSHASDIK